MTANVRKRLIGKAVIGPVSVGADLERVMLEAPAMVRVSVVLNAKSSRKVDELMDALRFVVTETRLQSGCDDCSAWSDPNYTVRYTSSWSSEDALRQYVRSSLFTSLLAIVETLGAPPLVQFDFVANSRGLDYVAEVRGEPVL